MDRLAELQEHAAQVIEQGQALIAEMGRLTTAIELWCQVLAKMEDK